MILTANKVTDIVSTSDLLPTFLIERNSKFQLEFKEGRNITFSPPSSQPSGFYPQTPGRVIDPKLRALLQRVISLREDGAHST